MELEKEIFTKGFDSAYSKAVVNVIYTYGWLTNHLKQELDKYNITHQQYNVLRILRGQHPKPSTINLLKERMLDKMSDASRIVERLVQKELVSKNTCKSDKRAVDIFISQKGLEVLNQIEIDTSIKEVLSKNVSEEEIEALNSLLDKLRG